MERDDRFYDDWTNRNDAERAKLHARELYDHLRRYQEASQRGHLEYGKWLIASLLATHGGALYAISGLRTSVRGNQIGDLVTAASWNLAGVCLTLLAAFFAWLNFQFAEHIYHEWSDPAMLYRSDRWPKIVAKTDPVNACLFLAAAFGLLSGFAFLVSAVTVVQALHPH
ncbi:hypothetical protein [Sinorhizobium americanum]|uniref:Transmembrane protein n=1 Tax=Sinorhizobium americanum TaxID=194963 RepID=A0A4R2BWD0_9HYPH|nr:hypothetical protein [Sinorhizobium americanum]TCN30364.1 hypothetical protein EV184_108238 [Sinorhizobium americanum]